MLFVLEGGYEPTNIKEASESILHAIISKNKNWTTDESYFVFAANFFLNPCFLTYLGRLNLIHIM